MYKLVELYTKRMFKSWNIYLAVVIIVISSLFSLKSNADWFGFQNLKVVGGLNLFVFSNTLYNNITVILAPFIAALPFCDSICDDIKSGFFKNMIIDPAASPMIVPAGMMGFFAMNYAYSMLGYCVVFIIHSFCIGCTFGLFSYGIGINIPNKLVVYALPTLVFYMLMIIAETIVTSTGSAPVLLPYEVFHTDLKIDFWIHLCHIIIIFVAALILVLIGYSRMRNDEFKMGRK